MNADTRFKQLAERVKTLPQFNKIMRRSHPFHRLRGLYNKVLEYAGSDAIEVGTFGGLSSCVMAMAIAPGTLYTVDIDPKMVKIARKVWSLVGLQNISTHVNDSTDFLRKFNKSDNVKLALIDGHHSYRKCMADFKLLRGIINEGVVILDDYGAVHPDAGGDGGVPRVLRELGEHSPINPTYTCIQLDREV